MAPLCQRQDHGWRTARPLQGALDCARAALWSPLGNSGQPGRLPRLCGRTAGERLFTQHNQDRPGTVAGLSALAIWGRRADSLDTASIKTARPLVDEGRSAGTGGRRQDPAYQVVPDIGPDNRRAGWRDIGPNLGPDRLCPRDNRLPAIRALADQQAAHSGADERTGPRGARNSPQGATERLCDRVRREAAWQRQEGAGTAIQGNGDQVLAPRPSAQRSGVDGARGRADAEDCAVPGPHLDAGNGAGLRAVLTLIYAGCKRRNHVLSVHRYTEARAVHSAKALKLWWALTGSNRRPSRCKQQGPTANCGFPAKMCVDLRYLCRFRFACVPAWCTCVHSGPMGDWRLHTGPHHNERRGSHG